MNAGTPRCEPALLSIAQIRRDFEDMVVGHDAEGVERAENVSGQFAAARAELEHIE